MHGVVRSGSRVLHGWKHAKWSRGLEVVTTAALRQVASGWWKFGAEESYWNEESVGRDVLLEQVRIHYPQSRDDETGRSDVILREGFFWNWGLLTATEYHGGGDCLTRVRILARPQVLMRSLALLLVVAMIGVIASFLLGILPWENQFAIPLVVVGLGAALFRLSLRWARPKVSAAAQACGMTKVRD
jgi:hypothetical protein